jgi:uncharacterized protein YukE
MGSADSSMKNISQVENYSKNLHTISIQVEQVFDKLKRQTDEIGQNWSDSQFNEFRAQFNESIIKQIKGLCATLQRLSEYSKKQCEFHRMSQQHRL